MHCFDPQIAKDLGVNCAVLFQNLKFWIEKNQANNAHFYEDRHWTYNSAKAFCELFPYFTERQIYTALQKLIDAGYIKKGNFNQNSFDRTCWYALGDTYLQNADYKKQKYILQKSKMEIAKKENDINVTDINADINANINSDSAREQKEDFVLEAKTKKNVYSEEFESFWQIYKIKQVDKKEAYQKFLSALKKYTAEQILQGARNYMAFLREKYPNIFINSKDPNLHYVIHPKRFLEKERFLVEYGTTGKFENGTASVFGAEQVIEI